METPVLALTPRRVGIPADSRRGSATIANMRQLVKLRWAAVCGQLFAILVVHFGLGVQLPLGPMLGVVALLAFANLTSGPLLARRRIHNVQMMLALLIDIAALTVQLYLSGGATNPFISFYLLQVVLGAIVLEIWSAWVLVAVTSLCFAGLIGFSVPLVFPPALAPYSDRLHLIGAWISFALTAALLGLFSTRFTRNLRSRDRYLADLRQRAAEEDWIVRMGLFASGAAHELGTPLASLAVILSDWRRMPRLANDPELAGELEEMRAEVERCKGIVTEILNSAGEPRVEAMESTDACAFLGEVAATWRPTLGSAPLDDRCEGLEGAAVVASASLRQAIWNLLDNAAEASPRGIAMIATRDADMLVVDVTDAGPGFSPAQLATVGKPYQSSKGVGHGLGLFLAVNVARRLGGRLEAGNRVEGGASVRLILPLAPDRRRRT